MKLLNVILALLIFLVIWQVSDSLILALVIMCLGGIKIVLLPQGPVRPKGPD